MIFWLGRKGSALTISRALIHSLQDDLRRSRRRGAVGFAAAWRVSENDKSGEIFLGNLPQTPNSLWFVDPRDLAAANQEPHTFLTVADAQACIVELDRAGLSPAGRLESAWRGEVILYVSEQPEYDLIRSLIKRMVLRDRVRMKQNESRPRKGRKPQS